MAGGQVRVAVVGAGDVGRGWATLCAAHGWPVSIYDNDSAVLHAARDEIVERARGLPVLVGLDTDVVEAGLASLTEGRSLLQACGEAEWVIEAIHEDLIAKQKLFESLETAAPKARIITSSSATLTPQDIAARCRRPDRVLVAHPQQPTELIPLVEILNGPDTDKLLIEVAKGWLRALDRIPVTLKKPVPGNIGGRMAAAVWREAIQLVLDGVIDVDDLDRAISVGPGLVWAAAGPHLSYHLAAGRRGTGGHVQQMLQRFEVIWGQLATWDHLDPQDQHRLIAAIERAYADQTDAIRQARDRRLAAMLQALGASRTS
ncbi:MAG: 3-hydroxyacyl-CoA dehydrogenase NAD-binding domain-containing protein [Gemmatimonadota bacterium]|nr:3-hydroxyacyl-CoA dehydrogenase NAD-binding domain-containing protein [Gemmatimonadota bacterium]MDH4349680.1 3-hydroxyacyl-CoA dehydrogenase NAD-binding domain-containing protein [Gemmatimonadota bacterium]MDH5196983.1 3-hydroxyacyl-CoA dehydrogenase NAD-binding domain-containing protein [Gemmatimonadota bacterium]